VTGRTPGPDPTGAPWWSQNGRDVIVVTHERRDGSHSQILTSPVGREEIQAAGRLVKDHGDERLYQAQRTVRDGLDEGRER
jgi:hypothetical protein